MKFSSEGTYPLSIILSDVISFSVNQIVMSLFFRQTAEDDVEVIRRLLNDINKYAVRNEGATNPIGRDRLRPLNNTHRSRSLVLC